MKCRIFLSLVTGLIILTVHQIGFAQDTPEEPLRVATEEVHLNVTALTSGGRRITNLVPDDLLIVEEGTPQKIESLKKTPASVLFLLDTGGNVNFVKDVKTTRLTAQVIFQKLTGEHSFAVIQAYNKIETVSDWTKDREKISNDFEQKLFSGNRSRFADGVDAALELFRNRSIENRHLVFIGDALDTVATAEKRRAAFEKLIAANITVHVVAFNQMEAIAAAEKPFRIGEKNPAPRIPPFILEDMIRGLPRNLQERFRAMTESRRLIRFNLDKALRRLLKEKAEAWKSGSTELENLATETGGFFQAPESPETLLTAAFEIANVIDSQYVVTYVPTQQFSGSEKIESRKVRVSTHCNGVVIKSRLRVVLTPKPLK